MTEDSEIVILRAQITDLAARVSELEQDVEDIREYHEYLRREDNQVTLALLDAIEEMQNVLSEKLDIEFNNKMISLPINRWVDDTRRELRKSGQ